MTELNFTERPIFFAAAGLPRISFVILPWRSAPIHQLSSEATVQIQIGAIMPERSAPLGLMIHRMAEK